MICKNGHKFSATGPPPDYIPFILADRFPGTPPTYYQHMPADERAKIIRILGVEGLINRKWNEANEGVEPGTDVFVAEFEYDLWDDD
jgi:hypothetical protein